MNNKEKLRENTLDLLEYKKLNSKELFIKSIGNFKLSMERSFFLLFLFSLCAVVLKTIIFPSTAAITVITDLTVNTNTVIVPIFAVIITGYAIFQALANENTIITLLTVKHEGTVSKFAIYNLYFFGIVCCYLILIITNFILLFIFKYFPEEWSSNLFSNTVNEIIAAVCISFYFVVLVNFIIEIKSFVYNLFQVFITSASSSSIANIKKSDSDKPPYVVVYLPKNRKRRSRKKKRR